MEISAVVDSILKGGDIRQSIKDSIPKQEIQEEAQQVETTVQEESAQLNEGFPVGSYLKFNHGVTGYFAKPNNGDDVYLVFEQPIDGLQGPLNPSVTFKLIGYNGSLAKIVAMVNDNLHGKKSGEVYFVNRAEMESKAKRVQPRMNKAMAFRYPLKVD